MVSLVSRDKFSGEKVPTLQEAVEECIRHQLTIFFDVKGQPDKVLNILTKTFGTTMLAGCSLQTRSVQQLAHITFCLTYILTLQEAFISAISLNKCVCYQIVK